jgi:hypothetical protein
MNGALKILFVAVCSTLLAAQCSTCPCDEVIEKQSIAAGWCTLTIQYCDGTEETFPVDEVEYESYNVGDCYP